MTGSTDHTLSWRDQLRRIDQTIADVEKVLASIFCALVCLLIVANIVIRAARIPVYWIDEAAIYAMAWMAFLASSAAVQSSEHVMIDLFTKNMPPILVKPLETALKLLLLALGLILIVCAYLWFDPITLMALNGDTHAFAERTFNFIYSEPTASFNAPKAVFWLIMPIFSLMLTFHVLIKLIAPATPEQETRK